jgi:hypothetical protein
MALITIGSINDFAVRAKPEAKSKMQVLGKIGKIAELKELAENADPSDFEFVTSADPRGIALRSILLSEGFEGLLQNVFNPVNEVYFLAWAWDMSGMPVEFYPGLGADPDSVRFNVQVGKVSEFLGEGVNLFTKRRVKGGICLRVHLFESDQASRDFGKTLEQVADEISKSKLNNLLSLIASATGAPGATLALAKEAALELSKVIGIILKANGNDFVDFAEGYFPADKPWVIGEIHHPREFSEIKLSLY